MLELLEVPFFGGVGTQNRNLSGGKTRVEQALNGLVRTIQGRKDAGTNRLLIAGLMLV